MGVGLAAVVVACGPGLDDSATDVTVRTCGQEGPIELIADFLPWSVIGVVDDRLVVVGSPTPEAARQAWAVGPCGEDPVLLAAEDDLGPVGVVGDVVYACDDAGRMTWLDPHGREASRLLFEHSTCQAWRLDAGLVVEDPERQEALLRRAPDDASGETVVLASSLREVPWPITSSPLPTSTRPLDAAGQTIYVLDASWVLSAIDTTTLGVSVVAEGVQEYSPSPDGQWLFIEKVAWGDDARLVAGATQTIDLGTGVSFEHAQSGWPFDLQWPYATWLSVDDEQRLGLVDLRTGTRTALPVQEGYSFERPSEAYVIEARTAAGIHHYAFSEARGQWQSLGVFPDCAAAYQRDGRFELLDRDDCDGSGDVLVIDYETGAADLVATEVRTPFIMLDDRTVWSSRGSDRYGDLLVVDGPDEPRLRLARDAKLLHDARVRPTNTTIDGDILYGVSEEAGGGLWRTALP